MKPKIEGRVAGPTHFGELVPATAAFIIWFAVLLQGGWAVALHVIWVLLLGFPLAAWTLLMRLRYNAAQLQRTIGPWRNQVDLTALQSIKWKMTGGWRSQGMIFVCDRHGGRVGIYVDRFNKVEEWGPLLLESAARCNAEVDRHSRAVLQPHEPKDTPAGEPERL